MALNPRTIKIGWFLGLRQLKRSSIWTNVLIVVIMILTFLNLVVVSGLLVGLIEGAVYATRTHYTGDMLISSLKEKNYVENSQNILAAISNINGIHAVTARYMTGGTIESNYQQRTNFNDEPETVSTIVAGINPENENEVTHMEKLIVEGKYLESGDYDEVLVGAMLLKKYLNIESPGFTVLEDVEIGSKIRLTIGSQTREFRVKGILKSKVDEIDRRVFMTDSQLRSMIARNDLNVSEISVALSPGYTPTRVKNILIENGFDRDAKIQTYEDAQPKFLQDIKNTFALLGSIISSIGLVVAAITIFIVIFINALTRRKYIGILKGIGVDGTAIELSYVFQSLTYALIGSAIGLFLVYVLLVPFFSSHPINFPFSDGILVAPAVGTSIRIALLILTTVIAGYVPARIIVSKNTLDSILGRK